MNFKFLREYMTQCERHGWIPSWEGLAKYVKEVKQNGAHN